MMVMASHHHHPSSSLAVVFASPLGGDEILDYWSAIPVTAIPTSTHSSAKDSRTPPRPLRRKDDREVDDTC